MNFKQFLSIVEMRTKIISMSTLAVALCYTLYEGFSIDPLLLALLVPAILFVDMGTTAVNTLLDFLRGTDNAETNKEPMKVLVHEQVSPNAALWSALGCYAAAGIFGAALSFLTSWHIAAAGALSILVGAAYTAGPFPISRTPVGEIFAGGFLGSVLFAVVFYTFSGTLTFKAILVSLPSFFIIASVLTANNTCDMEGDAQNGRKTLSIVIGRPRAEALVYALGSMGFLSLAALYYYGVVPPTIRFPLGLGLFALFFLYKKMHTLGFSHDTKHLIMQYVSLLVVLYTLVAAAGYGWYFLII
ncbi:MAG: prenyltransferase [Spirochaetales bacterium]|nr:prenyltransferase [Spirochaetales bacterium]